MRLSRLAQACDCDFSVGSTSKPSFKCSARRPADARIDWTPEIGVVVMAGLPVLAVVVVVAVGGEDEVAVNVVSRSGVECCDGVVWSILALFVGKPSYFGEKIMVTATCLFLHCEVHGCALSFDLLWSFFGLDHHTNKTFCQPQCPFEISTSSPGAGPQLPVHNCRSTTANCWVVDRHSERTPVLYVGPAVMTFSRAPSVSLYIFVFSSSSSSSYDYDYDFKFLHSRVFNNTTLPSCNDI